MTNKTLENALQEFKIRSDIIKKMNFNYDIIQKIKKYTIFFYIIAIINKSSKIILYNCMDYKKNIYYTGILHPNKINVIYMCPHDIFKSQIHKKIKIHNNYTIFIENNLSFKMKIK